MSSLPVVPLFVGGVELLMLGAIILVMVFGSKATDIARGAGSTAGKVKQTRESVEQEINEVTGTVEESVEPIKEEAEAVEEDIKSVEEDLDATADDDVASERSETGDDGSGKS